MLKPEILLIVFHNSNTLCVMSGPRVRHTADELCVSCSADMHSLIMVIIWIYQKSLS